MEDFFEGEPVVGLFEEGPFVVGRPWVPSLDWGIPEGDFERPCVPSLVRGPASGGFPLDVAWEGLPARKVDWIA